MYVCMYPTQFDYLNAILLICSNAYEFFDANDCIPKLGKFI